MLEALHARPPEARGAHRTELQCTGWNLAGGGAPILSLMRTVRRIQRLGTRGEVGVLTVF